LKQGLMKDVKNLDESESDYEDLPRTKDNPKGESPMMPPDHEPQD
jgi:hypothetical protein